MQALLAGINYLVLSVYLTPSSYGLLRGLLSIYTFAIVFSAIGFNPLLATRKLDPDPRSTSIPFSVAAIPFFSVVAYVFIVFACYKLTTSLDSVIKASICLYLMYAEIVLSSLVDFWCIRVNKTHWIFVQLVAPALVRLLGSLFVIQIFSPGYKLIFGIFTFGSLSSLLISIGILFSTGFFTTYVNLFLSINLFRFGNYCSTLKTSFLSDRSGLYSSLSWSLQSAAISIPLIFIATTDTPKAAAIWANLTLVVKSMFLPVTSYYARKIHSIDHDLLGQIAKIIPQSKWIFLYIIFSAFVMAIAIDQSPLLPYNLSKYLADETLCILVFGTGVTSIPVVFIRANLLKPQLSRKGLTLSFTYVCLLIGMLCLIHNNPTSHMIAIVVMIVDITYTATAFLRSKDL